MPTAADSEGTPLPTSGYFSDPRCEQPAHAVSASAARVHSTVSAARVYGATLVTCYSALAHATRYSLLATRCARPTRTTTWPTAWHDSTRHGGERCGSLAQRRGTARHSALDAAWRSVAGCGAARLDAARHHSATAPQRHGTARGTARRGTAPPRLDAARGIAHSRWRTLTEQSQRKHSYVAALALASRPERGQPQHEHKRDYGAALTLTPLTA